MIKSMTGYGSATHDDNLVTLNIEAKTLNSKFLDVTLKIPKQLSVYEVDIRNLITKNLVRGKVSFTIDYTVKQDQKNRKLIDSNLFEQYYSELKAISSKENISNDVIFNNTLTIPDVVIQNQEDEHCVDKDLLLELCRQALKNCNDFRAQEGEALRKEFESSINSISQKLEEIIRIDPERVNKIKSRISDNIHEYISSDKIDENRFEQELIYYIEKLDINEETSRLGNHLKYFEEVLAEPESQGKKLGFIGQEMGREINTIGSKANNSDIQRLVVDMKDELEKIKEQVLNAV